MPCYGPFPGLFRRPLRRSRHSAHERRARSRIAAARPTGSPESPSRLKFRGAGDRVRWRDRAGTYRRDAGDGEHVEIVIAERVYRVRGPSCGRGEADGDSVVAH